MEGCGLGAGGSAYWARLLGDGEEGCLQPLPHPCRLTRLTFGCGRQGSG